MTQPRTSPELFEVYAAGGISSGNDDRFDFATRARLCISEVREPENSPPNLLVFETVDLRALLPDNLKRSLGRKGVYLYGIEYRDTPLQELTGAMTIARLNLAQLTHLLPEPFGPRVYAADPKAGKAVSFPALPSFAQLTDAAYGEFCASKVPEAAPGDLLLDGLLQAAREDKTKPLPDRTARYTELSRSAPADLVSRIRRLANSLYAYQGGSEMPPALAAVLMEDPDIALVAEAAACNKASYVTRIEGRTYTPSLARQLEHIRLVGPVFHSAVRELVAADTTGYNEYLTVHLGRAASAARQATGFADHLSLPQTMPLDHQSKWAVRAR